MEPVPIRVTGHLWGSDAEFSLEGIRSRRQSTDIGTIVALEEVSQRFAGK
jgi:hypothetical protein